MIHMRSLPESLYVVIRFDQFPAQVIAAYDRAYQQVPFVVIQQDPDSCKSTLFACSAAALQQGIHPGMPVSVITSRYPAIEIVPRNDELEHIAREELTQLLYGYTPQYAIGRDGTCLVDLTATPLQRTQSAITIAQQLKNDITRILGMTIIAIGGGVSKPMASMMARLAMPDGIRFCGGKHGHTPPSYIDTRLLPGLSGQCREKIRKYGLQSIGQIQQLPHDELRSRFGKEGEKLYALVHGIDCTTWPTPHIRIEETTRLDRDTNDMHTIIRHVRITVDKFCYAVKKTDMLVKSFTVVLVYADNKRTQKSIRLSAPTNDFLIVIHHAVSTFKVLYRRRIGIKRIMLQSGAFTPDPLQTYLFESSWEKKQKAISSKIQDVRQKMGFAAVMSGSTVGVSKK